MNKTEKDMIAGAKANMLYLSDINPTSLKTNNTPKRRYYQKNSLNVIKENMRSLKQLRGKREKTKIKKLSLLGPANLKDFPPPALNLLKGICL